MKYIVKLGNETLRETFDKSIALASYEAFQHVYAGLMIDLYYINELGIESLLLSGVY